MRGKETHHSMPERKDASAPWPEPIRQRLAHLLHETTAPDNHPVRKPSVASAARWGQSLPPDKGQALQREF